MHAERSVSGPGRFTSGRERESPIALNRRLNGLSEHPVGVEYDYLVRSEETGIVGSGVIS